MSNLDLQTLEGYLFAQEKQEFIEKLVPGTEAYNFLSLLYSINSSVSLSADAKELLKKYTPSKTNRTPIQQNIKLRALLKQFDDPSASQSEKNKVITELQNEYLHLNFHYTQPANIVTSNLDKNEENIPSTLDQKVVSVESVVNNVYQNHNLNTLHPNAFVKLDTNKIAEGHISLFEDFILRANPLDFENFPQLLIQFVNKKKKNISNYTSERFFQKLTLKQLYELKDLEPELLEDWQYVQALFKKEFKIADVNSFGKELSKQERRDLLIKIYTWGQEQKMKDGIIPANALYEILQLDLELNRYDQTLFLEFLDKGSKSYSHQKKDKKKSKSKDDTHDRRSSRDRDIFGEEKIRPDSLIKKYLEEFFKEAKDIKPFNTYLDSEYLTKIFNTVKLMKGETKIKDELPPEELQDLKNSKELTICQYNQDFYRNKDKVTITLAIKNVPSLLVKVFEFRPENFYLKQKKQLDASINLDGLIAAQELNFDFKELPIVKFTKEFDFELIAQKSQGIFIVDFIGNGLSSRAVIRKGKLAFIEKQTVAGQLFSIVDEDAKTCKGSRTGIWIKDRFYKADEKGRVLIPFSSEVEEQAILIHNDFAELTNIQLKPENLEFKCSYIYHRESFIMGNQAKVLIQPKLFLNEQSVGLDLVQECNAEVVMNTEDDVPSIVTFENVKLSNYEEKQLDFTIPAKLASIEITLKAKILPVNQEEPKEYTSTHRITVSTQQRNFSFCDLYLKYTPDGHQVYLLGKNGEPKTNIPISFIFRNKFSPNPIHQKLQTDKEGKVSLGQLEEITRVEATISQHGDIVSFQRQWNINNLKTINYPSQIRICEGDQVILPLLHNELNRHKFSFSEELQDGTLIHNLLSYLKIDKRKLVISDLKEGFYKIFLKDIDQEISITVLKGTYWSENEDYLYTKNLLINVKADINNIIITNLKINQLPDSELADITLQTYADQPKLTRFHIFGAQFMESDPEKIIQDMDSTIPDEGQGRDQVFLGLKHNQYLNNRKLGDEYCYVLDRKTQARYLGNTLDKPKILLKQTFVRDTQTKQEQLQQNQEFQNIALSMETPSFMMAPGAKRKGGGGAHYDRSYDEERRGVARIQLTSTKSLNFLGNPCLIESNVGLDKNGQIILKDFPIKKYPLLQIIGTNTTANISQVFPLDPNSNIQTKDLRQEARDENAVFSISRRGVQALQGEKVAINDLASSSFLVIDTLKKLFEVQRNLASCNHTYQYNDTAYDAWAFLKNWQDLTFEEKLRKYDKFAGHELNLFVFCRDKKFFEDVVLPFLHNKTEKTLVDFFLLNDQEALNHSARPENFNKLNALEKVLIILYVQTFDKQQAKHLADSLQNLNDLNKTDPNIFKKYFDTVLAFQKDQDNPFDGAAPDMLQPPRMSAPSMMMFNALPQAERFSTMNMPMQQMQQQLQQQLERGVYGGLGGSRTKQTARLSTGGSRGGRGGSFGVMKNKKVSRDRERDRGFADLEEKLEDSFSRSRSRGGSSSESSDDDDDDDDDDYSPRNGDEFLEKRKKIKAGYQELGKTKEYTERHYYGRPQTQVSIQLNQFWIDLARHIVEYGLSKPFLTHNFITAHSSHSEMIAVLSFISLPFTAGEHKYTPRESRGLEIEAGSDLILMTKTIEEAESDLKNDVIVIQRFYDPQDRYTKSTEEPGLQIEKEIDQYIVDKVYGCTVIITNLSTSVQQAQVLVEVPEGSIPVQTQDYTKFHDLTIAAYATQTIEFFFYFPQVGKFRSNPPNVSKKGKVLAVAKSFDFQIQKEKVYNNLDTLDAVLSTGSQDDILEFARTKNIWDPKVFNFHSIYWLLLKKPFFLKFIQVLRERKYFDLITWQFGFQHKDVQTIQEYLAFDAGTSFPNCIQYLESSLLKIDKFKVLEYNPLVNQRVHLLHSEKNRILNAQLEEQYKKVVTYLCERSNFEVKHYLGLVYYLFLQDRVDEAIRFFSQINKEDIEMNRQYQLQYDYFAAYIDFVIGYPKFSIAKEICQKYLTYPVLSWRKLFIEISEQLEEAEEKEPDHMEIEASGESKKEYGNKQNQQNAIKEEVVTLEIQKAQLEITHQNLSEFTLAFYRVDLEVLFSKNPFITKEKDEFSFIQPAESKQIRIDNTHDLQKTTVEIPENLRRYNLYIDLKTENKTLSETYFSNSLKVHLIEAYGQVKVLDLQNKPLPKVYVKCFAKNAHGSVSFYKDGYTDLRGRFDYASLNSGDLSNIKKFAIFVMSDDLGSLIKEANAPQKLGRIDNGQDTEQIKRFKYD